MGQDMVISDIFKGVFCGKSYHARTVDGEHRYI